MIKKNLKRITGKSMVIMGIIHDFSDNSSRDYEHLSRQLSIIDSKAQNILLVDSILIVISTLLFSEGVNFYTQVIGTVAVLATLGSVIACIWTMKIKWIDSFSVDSLKTLKNVREERTENILLSVKILFIALLLYVSMFVVDLLLRIPRV